MRGGYGLFYGRTPSIMVGTAHSNNGINVISVRLTGNQVPRYPSVLGAPPTGIAGRRAEHLLLPVRLPEPARSTRRAPASSASSARTSRFRWATCSWRDATCSARATSTSARPFPPTSPCSGGGSVAIQRFPTARPFTNFARILSFESTAESTYNGFTLEARKRFASGFQATLAYTLGKVTDTKPDATAVVPGNPGDDAKYVSNPADFEADRAAGDLDQRHRLVFSGIWDIDYFKDSGGAVRAILGGWQMSWISTIETGLPYNRRITGTDVNRDQNPSNDIVPGFRNSERLPTQYNTDFRLQKRIALGPRLRLDLIGEAFNIFNQTNVTAQQSAFYNYNGTALVPQQNLSNPRLNFGTDSAALLLFEPNSRIVQLAAKLTF